LTQAFASAEVEGAILPADVPVDEDALNRFRMGLDDALRRLHPEGLPQSSNQNPVLPGPGGDAIDQAFRRGLQRGDDFEGVKNSVGILESIPRLIAVEMVPVPELLGQAISTGFVQVGPLRGVGMADVLPGLFSGPFRSSEAAGPEVDWEALLEPTEPAELLAAALLASGLCWRPHRAAAQQQLDQRPAARDDLAINRHPQRQSWC
jgi:hypothetical protein